MKILKKTEFLDNGIFTKKYYFFGIRYLKKIYSDSFQKIYLFKFRFFYKKKQEQYEPHVTVIVPNYNHSKFLQERLDCIYNQTYKNFNVILLDDCSNDNSRDILTEYAKKYSTKTKTIFNTENSGGVFYQWAKALKSATGELIWIAESDDYCELNFLEKMVKHFKDESVMLAFCKSLFVKNKKITWDSSSYLNDLPYNWNKSFSDTTQNLIKNGFDYKNIICNVSSALFRNTGFESIINNSDWYQMKICGDWMFYLNIAKGGRIAYEPKTINYYRQHDTNTSVTGRQQETYFKEHYYISKYIMEYFDTTINNFKKLHKRLSDIWYNETKRDKSELDKIYDLQDILSTKRKNKNIIIASYGFYVGGGETFPIYLANELQKIGNNITFICFESYNQNQGIRDLLDKSIPVLYKKHESSWFNIFKDFGSDICYSGYFDLDFDIAKSIKPLKCKHCVTLHGMYECMSDSDLSYALPYLSETVSKWIYIADKNLPPFTKHGIEIDEKFIKLPNGLPLSKITPISRDSLGISTDDFVMTIVSRGIPDKGWAEAIEATKILNSQQHNKKVHLIICGNGEMHDKLSIQELPEYIHLVGFQKNTRDYIACADILLLPSKFRGESFPLCIIDSIFCGKPVIGTNVGEVKNMLTVHDKLFGATLDLEADGSLSSQKLADTILPFLSENLSKKYSKIAKILTDKYNIQNVAKLYQGVYDNV